jgi:hypothetical protein
MKLKKVATIFGILLVTVLLTSQISLAADWVIQGNVTTAGTRAGRVYVIVEDDGSNFWPANAIEAQADEILAVALTAASLPASVQCLYDTDTAEWKEMRITNLGQ